MAFRCRDFAFMVLVGVLGLYVVQVVSQLTAGWAAVVTIAPSGLVGVGLWFAGRHVFRRAARSRSQEFSDR